MSLQTIIDNATYLEINKQKVAATSVSRSGRILTAERVNAIPYRFKVGMHSGLTYSDNRDLVEALDALDTIVSSNVDIGASNTNLNYITSYQGSANTSQVNQLVMSSTGTANLVIDTSSVSGTPGGNLFVVGDVIQPAGNTGTYKYPYNVTSNVAWNASSVTVPVHRPVLAQDGVALTSGGVRVGTNCRYHLKLVKKPKTRVLPHNRLGFTEDFELVEVIT